MWTYDEGGLVNTLNTLGGACTITAAVLRASTPTPFPPPHPWPSPCTHVVVTCCCRGTHACLAMTMYTLCCQPTDRWEPVGQGTTKCTGLSLDMIPDRQPLAFAPARLQIMSIDSKRHANHHAAPRAVHSGRHEPKPPLLLLSLGVYLGSGPQNLPLQAAAACALLPALSCVQPACRSA